MDCWRSIVEGWLLKTSLILVNFLISSKKKPKEENTVVTREHMIIKLNSWLIVENESKAGL